MEKLFLTVVAENGKKFVIECDQNGNPSEGTGTLVGSKVKTLKVVDDEKLQKIQEVAQQVTPAWRLEQMFALVNDTVNGGVPTMEKMGAFMKALNQDIIKEESDVMVSAGLEPKEVFSVVARIARQWYSEELDRLVFNK